jgi:hypothetical protein
VRSGFAWLRGDPWVPLTAFCEDVAQQHHLIGHHAVRTEVEGPLDLLAAEPVERARASLTITARSAEGAMIVCG